MRGFPQHILAPEDELYRIHRAANGPWYFRNDGSFRFDLIGNPRHGTCYFAEHPLGAFVETLQSFRAVPIPREELDDRKLFKVKFDHTLSIADVTKNAAGSFQLDASISAGAPSDYQPSQEFANRAYAAGFAGVRFRVRHDLEQELIGIALFGPLGDPADAVPMGTSTEIPQSLVQAACSEIGFMVRGPLLEPV
jgi:hypothetical protein